MIKIGSQFRIYRDDQNHAFVSGNKLHKLAPYLKFAKQENIKSIISIGGAYSNHLHALAYACHQQQLHCIGIVRGQASNTPSQTLLDCQKWGMSIIYCPRDEYRELADNILQAQQKTDFLGRQDVAQLQHLLAPISDRQTGASTLVIGEGGSSMKAIYSLADAYTKIFKIPEFRDINQVVCATGTGATLAGLRLAAPEQVNVIGIQAVAEGNATANRIAAWIGKQQNLDIHAGHLGGFAKMPKDYLDFLTAFEKQNKVPLDYVYNGKVLYQLHKMQLAGQFSTKDRVLIIHTGGLQGKARK